MEYSKENTMTRKEYLKSKKKQNFFLSKFKYLLLIILVVLLGIYVFKQLNVYNNVTKIANKVVEETKLARTMTMYYVSMPYTKEGCSNVMLYKASDESRTIIPGTEGMENIQIIEGILYGVSENILYSINLSDYSKEKLTEKQIKDYAVSLPYIYISSKDGIYKLNIKTKQMERIINKPADKLVIDDTNIYVIAEGKTNKSIIKYGVNGKNGKQLSEKYIVSDMYLIKNVIYFINSKDSKIYSVSKSGGKITKLIDNKVLGGSDLTQYKDSIYYINKSDNNTLYEFNLTTKKSKKIINKNLLQVQIKGQYIYYTLANSIGMYKYNIEIGQTAQVTSIRATEFICIN